jgi:hypothetical protein
LWRINSYLAVAVSLAAGSETLQASRLSADTDGDGVPGKPATGRGFLMSMP